MRIKTLLSATAIACAMSAATASAADQFSVMKDVPAAKMLTTQQLDGVRGTGQRTAARVLLNRANAFNKSGRKNLNGVFIHSARTLGSEGIITSNPSP
jgi:hypothetical protein